MNASDQNRKERIGLVATDPMRVLGFKTLLEGTAFDVVPLSVPGALDDISLTLVLIDSECTGHPFQLISTFRQVRPQLRLIVFGGDTGHEHIERVIGAGAKGYLAFTATEADLRTAIDTVRDGSVWAPRKVLSRLLDREQGSSHPDQRPHFTARECQVLKLLREGQPNREIAHTLGIDEATVKAHLGRLMRKVGVSNRIALTVHPFTQLT